ncbi:hypothetical protein V5799_026273 [Amblyomma americanum]|uniref:Choline transporter-like protein n=1 Tax=Amblyomma americanum TaxID=6943 RepID=A0AAQ4DJ23_AMBAM
MPGLLLQPAWTLSFCAATAAAGAVAMLILLTAGDPVAAKGEEEVLLLRQDSLLRFGPWYLALALFWILQLAVSCQAVVVAGAAAHWYFDRGRCPRWGAPCASVWRLVRYHLGSVVLGSLLEALARMLRLACRLAGRRCRRQGKAACCLCACACRMLRRAQVPQQERLDTARRASALCLLSWAAAARGYGLCRAAREAWQLLSRNALRVATVNCVGDFVLLLAKGAVVAGTVLVGHRLIQDKSGQLSWGEWAPLCTAGLGALLVAHCFLSVYEMTLDTIFICFCRQCEDAQRGGAPAMPPALAAFVEKSGEVAPPTSRQ